MKGQGMVAGRRAATAIVLALCVAVGVFLAFHRASAGVPSISIANFAFHPASLTIRQGQAVTWTNQDQVPHTVTSGSGAWDSGTLTTGKSFEFRFERAGTFIYTCAIHPNMRGIVVVRAGANSTGRRP